MRRPGPLPPPEESAATPRPPLATTAQDAPLIPLARPEREREREREPEPQVPLKPEPHSAAPDDSGIRSVWRAARARRRVLRAEVRRFTADRRRRRGVWLASIGAVLLLALGSVGAAYSPLFGIERITVLGTSALDIATVQRALSGQLGAPLASVDESAVKAALVGFPLVESYRLEARPPHELVVRIVERTAVGAIQGPAGFSIVDAAGVVLSTAVTPPAGVPVITVQGGTEGAAFAAIGRVMRSLPEGIRPRVTAISASTPDDVAFVLDGAGARIVWGSADSSALKARVLDDTMASRPPESVKEYDVSSPSAVVVR